MSPTVDTPDQASKHAAVKRWLSRYDRAKAKWDKDFERMRADMEFVTGIQWDGQQGIRDAKVGYVANMALRMVSQKVAQLYARNPEVEAVPRKRMDFAIWDESVESLQDSFMRTMQGRMSGMMDPVAEATMQDFMDGRREQDLVRKMCRTLEILDTYDTETVKPNYKEQMKQLVRRVVTCGVGYVRPTFVREGVTSVSTNARHSTVDRAQVLSAIQAKVVEGEVDEESPELDTMRSLALSLGVSDQTESSVQERVEHDFLPPTSVIPDERCRQLKGFVAARWLFIEYPLQADEVNTMFGLTGDDKVTGKTNSGDPEESNSPEDLDESAPAKAAKVILVEVLDIQTKTHCYVVKGHEQYVMEPEPLDPQYPGFWPIVSLTFNDVEVDDSCERASIFPPSDVDLIWDPQKEWNRTRDALRAQRNANAPRYVVRKGLLSQNDIQKIKDAEPNSVVELENVPSDMEPSKLIQVLQVAAIDQNVYATQPLEQDFMLAGGMQQANMGPAQPDVTATVGTIAEQSRMTVSASNVDDLDEMLTTLAQMRGHLRMQALSASTVTRIAGRGSVWPVLNMQQYLDQILLRSVAASSGRPNRALEISNFERVAPIMMNAGANPIAIIEEAVRRLGDDRLDVQKFYPVPGMAANVQGQTPEEQGPPQGEPGLAPSTRSMAPSSPQPLQPLPSGVAVPLPAA